MPVVDRLLQPRSTGTRGWWRAVTPVTVTNHRRGPPPGVLSAGSDASARAGLGVAAAASVHAVSRLGPLISGTDYTFEIVEAINKVVI